MSYNKVMYKFEVKNFTLYENISGVEQFLLKQGEIPDYFSRECDLDKMKLSISPIVRPNIQPFRKYRTYFVKRPIDYTIGQRIVIFLQIIIWLNENCVRWLLPEKSASALNPTLAPKLGRFL